MIVGTAGHIDHGKTALVKALTGVDADRLKEEKVRGITIDLGFAYLPGDGDEILGFVDVPAMSASSHDAGRCDRDRFRPAGDRPLTMGSSRRRWSISRSSICWVSAAVWWL